MNSTLRLQVIEAFGGEGRVLLAIDKLAMIRCRNGSRHPKVEAVRNFLIDVIGEKLINTQFEMAERK